MKNLFIYIISLTVFASTAFAQLDIVSVNDAAKMIKNDDVQVISARTPQDYQKVHLPGAININHKDLYGEKSMLLPVDQLNKLLSAKGIDQNKTLLIYDDGSFKYSGRLYWIMSFLGVKDVKVVDGGMKAWRMGRKPVTKNPTSINATNFKAVPNNAILASMATVKKAIAASGTTLVDARSAAEFNGTATTQLRPGHIPNAINIDYLTLITEKGTLKTADELNALFTANNLTKNGNIIVYCESSVRAGIVFFALKGLGYTKVSVYDGAYLEWQSVTGNSIASN